MSDKVCYISAADLAKANPSAECCDCTLDPNDAPEKSTWTIWRNGHIYCPKCAKNENIGPNS